MLKCECKYTPFFRFDKLFGRKNNKIASSTALILEYLAKTVVMSDKFNRRIIVVADAMNSATLVASIVLLGAMSIEVTQGDRSHFSDWYRTLHFGVCSIFFAAAIVRLSIAEYRRQHWFRDLVFALVCIPYINIMEWVGWTPPREVVRMVAFAPILISLLATTIIIEWLIEGRTKRLMAAYVLTVLLFTYISALIFYDYEIGVNSSLHSFGDALWWAWLNVTTVGAPIVATTTIGKIVGVVLPVVGMMFFPIFTVYVSDYYNRSN